MQWIGFKEHKFRAISNCDLHQILVLNVVGHIDLNGVKIDLFIEGSICDDMVFDEVKDAALLLSHVDLDN